MVLEGTVESLAQKVLGGAYRIYLEANGTPRLENELRGLTGVVKVNYVGEDRYELEATRDLRAEAAQAVVQAGGKLFSLNIEAPNLEEIYTRYFRQEANYVYSA
jgi:ABC-2 type transport system ATP-binding protein